MNTETNSDLGLYNHFHMDRKIDMDLKEYLLKLRIDMNDIQGIPLKCSILLSYNHNV